MRRFRIFTLYIRLFVFFYNYRCDAQYHLFIKYCCPAQASKLSYGCSVTTPTLVLGLVFGAGVVTIKLQMWEAAVFSQSAKEQNIDYLDNDA